MKKLSVYSVLILTMMASFARADVMIQIPQCSEWDLDVSVDQSGDPDSIVAATRLFMSCRTSFEVMAIEGFHWHLKWSAAAQSNLALKNKGRECLEKISQIPNVEVSCWQD